MSILSQAREVTEEIADAARRRARRSRLEVELHRLESKADGEKQAIGHALFTLLEAGAFRVDNDEVQTHMSAITDLLLEISAKAAELEALRAAREREENRSESIRNIDMNAKAEAASQQSARDAWASEGGPAPEQGGQG